MAKKLPQKNLDLPATVRLVYEVRDELKATIGGVDHKIGSLDHRMGSLEHRVESLEHKVDAVDRKVDFLDRKMDAGFARLEAKISDQNVIFSGVLASVHNMQAKMEQQHSENRILYETLLGQSQRMDRIEQRQDKNDADIRLLVQSKNS